ncbi:MAG: PepSY-like domain-containing protein [Paludibacteraceae bacterium]
MTTTKKRLAFIAIFIASHFLTQAEREIIRTDISQIPHRAKAYLQQAFDTTNTYLVKIEKDQIGILTYAITMENGCVVLFDRKGDWTNTDCQIEELPKGAVPTSIWNYIKRNYKQEGILQIEKTRDTYKVKLTNRKTLLFDYRFNRIN